jgi:hypothetical protein
VSVYGQNFSSCCCFTCLPQSHASAAAAAAVEEWRHLAGLHQDDVGTLALVLGALLLAPATEVR